MSFYGSVSSNGQQSRPARHMGCPHRLKFIQGVQNGYIPFVEDSDYFTRLSYRNALQKTNRLGLYNTADAWSQELMGLAQQVQSSLPPLVESRQSRSSRLTRRRSKSSNRSIPTNHFEENDEQNISKRLLSRHASSRYQHSSITKPKLSIDENEQESSTNNKNQDSGIWLLPILCYILQIDNIPEAQDWLVNANPTEKHLALKLISRTMQDMQNHENEFISDQSSTSSNLNNLYWPYKFWQHQQQSKLTIDNNDTCERATSPVRILTPAKRLSTSTSNDRLNQSLQTSSIKNRTETRCSSSRLLTPMTANNSDHQSRHRITTSRSTSRDNDYKPMSANLRGKTPLI